MFSAIVINHAKTAGLEGAGGYISVYRFAYALVLGPCLRTSEKCCWSNLLACSLTSFGLGRKSDLHK